LPDDYFNTYVSRILSVTKEDVLRVARKYLDPEKVDIIVVGDRAQIEKGINELNLGLIRVMTIEGVLGRAPVIEGSGL
jgi:zinc protease